MMRTGGLRTWALLVTGLLFFGKPVPRADRPVPRADANSLLAHDQLLDKARAGDPTVRGYQIWVDALRPILTELLGLPAATDHAPPPTGDPSAAGGRRMP